MGAPYVYENRLNKNLTAEYYVAATNCAEQTGRRERNLARKHFCCELERVELEVFTKNMSNEGAWIGVDSVDVYSKIIETRLKWCSEHKPEVERIEGRCLRQAKRHYRSVDR